MFGELCYLSMLGGAGAGGLGGGWGGGAEVKWKDNLNLGK